VADRSAEGCKRLWQESVNGTREALADHPRYREVSYEDLRRDPAALARELFSWLGVDASESSLVTVAALSQERFSELGAVTDDPRSPSTGGGRVRRGARLARGVLARAERRVFQSSPPAQSANSGIGFQFARSLRERDADAIRRLTTESLTLTYRGPEGDVIAEGDAARTKLLEIAHQLFDSRHVGESWAAAEGGPTEWWTRAPGQPFWTIFFSGLGGDAKRADLAFGLTPENGSIKAVLVVSAGLPTGRPVRLVSATASCPAE
jgi:hypothetical protein